MEINQKNKKLMLLQNIRRTSKESVKEMTVATQVKSCYASIKSIEGTLKLKSLYKTTRNPSLQTAIEDANKLVAQIKSDMNHQVIELMKKEPQFKS